MMMVDGVCHWLRRVRQTNWFKYLSKNGKREWTHIDFNGFNMDPNSPRLYSHWWGYTTDNQHYYMPLTVAKDYVEPESEYGWEVYLLARKAQAKMRMDSFLDPNCRCRVGFHWKCSIHKRWEN